MTVHRKKGISALDIAARITHFSHFTQLMAFLLRLLLLTLLYQSPSALAAADVQEGKPAPAFESTLLDGSKFSLATQSGKVVVIHYWATWCPSCREEMPVLEAYYKAHQHEGLVMLAVSIDEPEDLAKAKEVMNAYSYPAALAANTKARAYGRIWRVPLTFVIDRQGILRNNGWFGEANLNHTSLDKLVTPLLKQAP